MTLIRRFVQVEIELPPGVSIVKDEKGIAYVQVYEQFLSPTVAKKAEVALQRLGAALVRESLILAGQDPTEPSEAVRFP